LNEYVSRKPTIIEIEYLSKGENKKEAVYR
jgi:hypothetical protein